MIAMSQQDQNAAQSQKPPVISQQTISLICGMITFMSGIAASQGLITEQTKSYLGSPEVLAFVGTAAGLVVVGIRAWNNRPHGLIKSTNRLKQVDAVVVKPKTAQAIGVPGVVPSVAEAAKVVRPVGKTTVTGVSEPDAPRISSSERN